MNTRFVDYSNAEPYIADIDKKLTIKKSVILSKLEANIVAREKCELSYYKGRVSHLNNEIKLLKEYFGEIDNIIQSSDKIQLRLLFGGPKEYNDIVLKIMEVIDNAKKTIETELQSKRMDESHYHERITRVDSEINLLELMLALTETRIEDEKY